MSTKFAQVFDRELRRRNSIIVKEPKTYAKLAKKVAELIARDYELNRALYGSDNRYGGGTRGHADIRNCRFLDLTEDGYSLRGKEYLFIKFDVNRLVNLVEAKLREWNYQVVETSTYENKGHGKYCEVYFLHFTVTFKS